jgi:hypothetical protein
MRMRSCYDCPAKRIVFCRHRPHPDRMYIRTPVHVPNPVTTSSPPLTHDMHLRRITPRPLLLKRNQIPFPIPSPVRDRKFEKAITPKQRRLGAQDERLVR